MKKKNEKIITAKTLREMAQRFGRLASNPVCLTVMHPKDGTGSAWAYDADGENMVQEMLLKAADIYERCEFEMRQSKLTILKKERHVVQRSTVEFEKMAMIERILGEKED